MDDTKYFEQAVTEYCLQRSIRLKVGDLTMGELSNLLRRAQELKDADRQRGPQPIVQALDNMRELT